MGGRARVTSLDALDAFAAALRVFQDEAARAIEGVEMNVRAAADWVRLERKEYWNRQLRRSEQRTHEAKINLQRCQTLRRVDDYRPACVEEKRDLERARRRQELCRRQVEVVSQWSRKVDRAVNEYQGGVSQLARWLETDVDRAVAVLERLRRTLEAYVGAAPAADVSKAVDSLPPAYALEEGTSAATSAKDCPQSKVSPTRPAPEDNEEPQK
ncbi:MAG: hypothetical protein RBS80_19350 [Thermoguttaceae bacterium]|jgi:hypothetical protein|nr:hypothetical protein [Thermoguttaceae bacterium]